MFEIRPRGYDNKCLHVLAEVCELHFYLALANGDKSTSLDVKLSEVFETLKLIKDRMDAEDKEIM